MSDQPPNSYLGFEFWNKIQEVTIQLALTGVWFWKVIDKQREIYFSDKYFQYASDAEQDLITFLKNSIL